MIVGNKLKLSGEIHHVKYQQEFYFFFPEKTLLKVAVGSDLLFLNMTIVLSVWNTNALAKQKKDSDSLYMYIN